MAIHLFLHILIKFCIFVYIKKTRVPPTTLRNINTLLIFLKKKNYNSKDLNTSLVSEPFVSYYSRNPQKEFDRIQKLAEETKGIVMPYLNDSYVEILQVEPHDFNSSDPLGEAKEWAEKNLVGTYTSHIGKLDQFQYMISKKAIKKYIDGTAINKSDNINVHLSTLKVLPQIIDASIEAEIDRKSVV